MEDSGLRIYWKKTWNEMSSNREIKSLTFPVHSYSIKIIFFNGGDYLVLGETICCFYFFGKFESVGEKNKK